MREKKNNKNKKKERKKKVYIYILKQALVTMPNFQKNEISKNKEKKMI